MGGVGCRRARMANRARQLHRRTFWFCQEGALHRRLRLCRITSETAPSYFFSRRSDGRCQSDGLVVFCRLTQSCTENITQYAPDGGLELRVPHGGVTWHPSLSTLTLTRTNSLQPSKIGEIRYSDRPFRPACDELTLSANGGADNPSVTVLKTLDSTDCPLIKTRRS